MRNAEQATNLIQTALGEMNGILLRMRELAVQSASSTVNDDNRTAINAEFTQLVNEIDRVARVTSYNDTALLSGYGNTVSQDATVSTALASPTTGVVAFQISGATSGTYLFADSAGDNEITLGNGVTTQTLNAGVISDMAANGVNLNLGSVSTSTLGAARSAIGAIDLAIDKVTTARGDLAAVQNRLGFSIRATGVMRENDMSSDSTIRDADIAAEVSAFSRAQILQQSGLAVFAQANVHAASALNLL
jgi:flagellin